MGGWRPYFNVVVALVLSIMTAFGTMFFCDSIGLDPWVRDWLAVIAWAASLGVMLKGFGLDRSC